MKKGPCWGEIGHTALRVLSARWELESESAGIGFGGIGIGGKRKIPCLGLGMRRGKAGFMDVTEFGLILCCHQLDT